MGASEGFIYYGVGEDASQEALRSLHSLRRHMPLTAVAMHTDRPQMFDGLNVATIQTPSPHQKPKHIELLQNSPFQKTVLLDCDTYLLRDCSELFAMLDEKDLYLLPIPIREKLGLPDDQNYNTGVIAVKKSLPMLEFLGKWERTFKKMLTENASFNDEQALSHTFADTKPDFGILPSVFNVRIGYVDMPPDPIILHGHNIDIDKYAAA